MNFYGRISGDGHTFVENMSAPFYHGADRMRIDRECIRDINKAIQNIAKSGLPEAEKGRALSLLEAALGDVKDGRGDKASVSGRVKTAAEIVQNSGEIVKGAGGLVEGVSALGALLLKVYYGLLS